jgi:hypothetical protein
VERRSSMDETGFHVWFVDTEGRVARDWIEEYQDEDDVRP